MKESAEPVIYKLNLWSKYTKRKKSANGKACSILKIGLLSQVSTLKTPSYKVGLKTHKYVGFEVEEDATFSEYIFIMII